MKHYKHEILNISDLIPYANNSRTHSDSQIKQIASSIQEFGFTNPVLIDEKKGIIAGHGRVLAAELIELKKVPCIKVTGLTEAQKKALVIADNQLALNADWDMELLKLEVDSLLEMDFELDVLGFEDNFLENLLGTETEIDNPYTDNVDEFHYEPSGEQPQLEQLYTSEKYQSLLDEIEKSDVPDDIKAFLRLAATRHIRFNYQRVADYYAHADKETQHLFESSVMVIVDFETALKSGYIQLKESLAEAFLEDSK